MTHSMGRSSYTLRLRTNLLKVPPFQIGHWWHLPRRRCPENLEYPTKFGLDDIMYSWT